VGLVMLAIGVLAAVFAPYLAPYDPVQMRLVDSRLPPSLAHPFGCDELGRDILSRVIYGFRISLTIGAISVGIGLAGGVVMGAAAGFFGGWVDLVVMRVVDIMLSFPAILLAIVVVVVLGPGLANAMVAIGVAQVPSYARLARATVLKWKSEQFVEAARALGASDVRIIARHILPNCVSPLIVESTLAVATSILSAASLGFLGLGAVPPTPEWGVMLSRGQTYMRIAPHITVFPGLAILVTVMAFNLVGDGLRDALDPRML
ncbi:MAG: ABC transporter permease, partial [Candidatus Bipolaricaulota bacterium]|nr:ABC transporter permease [Candidatus Bipolaricaulota bacterium]